MEPMNKKLIAVFGVKGQQGGGVVRALQASSEFKVRTLARDQDKHRQLAEEVVKEDLDHPETLKGAYGVFLVTNFREAGAGEFKQATAVRAAKDAAVKHFVWSTLPKVEAISGGKFDVPHFTGKAKVDRIVEEAGFPHHTFVIAPGYTRILRAFSLRKSSQVGPSGGLFRLIPVSVAFTRATSAKLGDILAGAFAHPDQAGNHAYPPLVGDFQSFNGIVETLNRQGQYFSYMQMPKEIFAGAFPRAAEVAEMIGYWEAHTYLGSDSSDQIALANKIAGWKPTKFSAWARVNFPANRTSAQQHAD